MGKILPQSRTTFTQAVCHCSADRKYINEKTYGQSGKNEDFSAKLSVQLQCTSVMKLSVPRRMRISYFLALISATQPTWSEDGKIRKLKQCQKRVPITLPFVTSATKEVCTIFASLSCQQDLSR